ncbi:hypothetical protein D9756_003321 [Leucocoprinus leucothites]|uniref:F-box domain-containing protein n=1 Tax=Leucocoprinus leucothites TaxID=201217 RepID=A0A8H5G714_9AGAR|nr:hypothetical protein D9756_003321 [Leucoagaricus leucothites]
MPTFDTFCAVTGWMHMWREEEFIEAISGETQGECLWGKLQVESDDECDGREPGHDTMNAGPLGVVPSRTVQRGLKYTDEDVDGTSRYVLVTPCERSADGRLCPRILWGRRPVEDLDKEEVAYLFNVYPSSEGPEMGIYNQHQPNGEIIEFTGVGRSFGSYLITFCSFLILQHLTPGLEARTFCKLALKANGGFDVFPEGVDYGPVSRTIMQDVMWADIAEIHDNDSDEDGDYDNYRERRWLKLLTEKGKTDEEILKEAWMGKGNMWIFKHPGIFPIEEAVKLNERSPPPANLSNTSSPLEASSKILGFPTELIEMILGHLLPEDALRFMGSTRRLYRSFRAGLDRYTYTWIKQERPWYLPVGPIDCQDGDEEVVRWQQGWKDLMGDDIQTSEGGDLPWLAYHFACKRSPNMRSRERIWGIVLQIKVLLEEANLYP